MTNNDLIEASKKGDFDSVKHLLSNQSIDINCKGILIHYYSLYSNPTFLSY